MKKYGFVNFFYDIILLLIIPIIYYGYFKGYIRTDYKQSVDAYTFGITIIVIAFFWYYLVYPFLRKTFNK